MRRIRRAVAAVRRRQEDLVHAAPAEVAQQAAQPLLGAPDVDVVPEARLGVDAGDARLPRVDLPGVEVEDRRLAVAVDRRSIQRDSA
jgi:hypothetical protein